MARRRISAERSGPIWDHSRTFAPALSSSSQTPFPVLLTTSRSERSEHEEPSPSSLRFRRITRISSWVRGRSSEPPTKTTPAVANAAPLSPSGHDVHNVPRVSPTSPSSPTIQIPLVPSKPLPLTPTVHPRTTRVSLGIDTPITSPSTSRESPVDGQTQPISPTSLRRRSISSPTAQSPRLRHSALVPRSPIVASSWSDYEDEPVKILSSQASRAPLNSPSSEIPRTLSSTDNSQKRAQSVNEISPQRSPSAPRPSSTVDLGSVSKLDFISHFEAITQLNLKMESGSGSDLSAQELSLALKYLFGRYHGVLDSVGVFRMQLEGENVNLRKRVAMLERQHQSDNPEILRLRSLLDQHGISWRLSSESSTTVKDIHDSAGEVATSPVSPQSLSAREQRPSSESSLPPFPPPNIPLPPTPPTESTVVDGVPTFSDAQLYLSVAPHPLRENLQDSPTLPEFPHRAM